MENSCDFFDVRNELLNIIQTRNGFIWLNVSLSAWVELAKTIYFRCVTYICPRITRLKFTTEGIITNYGLLIIYNPTQVV
jgi:hypothetical protein